MRDSADSPAAVGEKISFEDFLTHYDGQFAEWIDGEVQLMSPVSDTHDGIVFFVRCLLQSCLTFRPLGTVRGEPFTMKLTAGRGREPDLLIVLNTHQDRLKPTYLDGAADVVIEVVSPESVTRDRVTKYGEYQAAGVTEYWLIDPTPATPEALFYRLDATQHYQRLTPDSDGFFPSDVIAGFRLHVPTLWLSPLPDIIQAVEIARAMVNT